MWGWAGFLTGPRTAVAVVGGGGDGSRGEEGGADVGVVVERWRHTRSGAPSATGEVSMTVYRRGRGGREGCGRGRKGGSATNDQNTSAPLWVVRLLCGDDSSDTNTVGTSDGGGGNRGGDGGSGGGSGGVGDGGIRAEEISGNTTGSNAGGGGDRSRETDGAVPGGRVADARSAPRPGAIGVLIDGRGWGDLLNAAGTNLWHYHAALYGVWAAVAASTVAWPLPSPLPPPPWIAAAAPSDDSGSRPPSPEPSAVLLLLGPSVWAVARLPPDGTPFEATPDVMAALPGHTGVHLQGIADALRARLFVARTPPATTAAAASIAAQRIDSAEPGKAAVAAAAAAAAAAADPLRQLLAEASAGDGGLGRVVVPWRDGLLWDLAWDDRLAAALRSPTVGGCVCRGSLLTAYREALLGGALAPQLSPYPPAGRGGARTRLPLSGAEFPTRHGGPEREPSSATTAVAATDYAAGVTPPRRALHACLISRQDRGPGGIAGGKPARNLHPTLLLRLLQALRAPLFLAPSLGAVVPAGAAVTAAAAPSPNLPHPGSGVPFPHLNSSVAGQLRSISHECGVLVGAHGAGLVGALGLPPGGAVVELAVSARRYAYFANVAALVKDVTYDAVPVVGGGGGNGGEWDLRLDPKGGGVPALAQLVHRRLAEAVTWGDATAI